VPYQTPRALNTPHSSYPIPDTLPSIKYHPSDPLLHPCHPSPPFLVEKPLPFSCPSSFQTSNHIFFSVTGVCSTLQSSGRGLPRIPVSLSSVLFPFLIVFGVGVDGDGDMPDLSRRWGSRLWSCFLLIGVDGSGPSFIFQIGRATPYRFCNLILPLFSSRKSK